LIKENVEYDCLCEQYGKERMDEIVELLTDTVSPGLAGTA